MLQVQYIHTLDLPELEPYRTMKRQLDHRQQRIFVAEGEKVVRRLLDSRFTVVSLLLPEKWLRAYEPLLERRPEVIQAYVAEKEDLERLTGFTMYQGVLAVGRIPPLPSLSEILDSTASPRLFVALEGITNAQNLGGLVRNSAAFGAQALLVGETSSSPFLRRAVRSSMGAIFELPVVELDNLTATLRDLQSKGIRTIAAHPHSDRRVLSQAQLTRDCCLVFGSEGDGLTPALLEACDDAVAIPMPPAVDSLNVGSAAAVFLYEVNRQRGTM